MTGLRIQSQRLRTRRCGNGLLHRKVRRRIFLDHCKSAVALRTEGLHCLRVEGSAVAPVPNRQIGDDMSVGRRQDDHVLVIAARCKKDIVLGVQSQSGASSALARYVILADHLHRVRVDHGNRGLVFDVDIDLAVAVRGSLLRRTADVDGAKDRPILVIQDGNVRLRVAENVEVVIVSVVQVAIRMPLDVDFLENGKGL